ncbi:MAG TPA: flagellar motor protein MotB [Candidatus Acidoferrales bacterium]|nr:flagellar motor protein MotB [Candidatus Acidoferrales bacterium]
MSPEPEVAPPPPPPPRPIIIVKRKKAGHAGHHGGAWKVAYADFVTAMMALFIVLWLMSADKEVREQISAFFNNPTGPGKMTGTAAAGAGHAIEVPRDDMDKLRDKIQQALTTVPNFRNLKDHVEITITADGLRIELLETEAGMFFESGRPLPTEAGAGLLSRLAEEMGKLPNNLLIEGHTDAKPFAASKSYSNWELSTDRANAARRLMEEHGLRPEQVAQVRGYAERQLRHPEDPNAASNRRISVIVQYLTPTYTPAPESPAHPPSAPVDARKNPSSTAGKPSSPGSPRE